MTYDQDWKLKLRYGKLITPYKHGCLIGEVEIDSEGTVEMAFLSMKIWAKDHEEFMAVFVQVAETFLENQQKRLVTINEIMHGDAEMQEPPPSDQAYAYDININYFEAEPSS